MDFNFINVIYQSDYFSNLVGVLLLTLLYIFYLRKNKKEQIYSDSTKNYEFCNDPYCVRCNSKQLKNFEVDKYKQIKQNLKVDDISSYSRLDSWAISKIEDLDDIDQKPPVFYLPDVKSTPYIKSELHQFDVQLLEDNFSIIYDEFLKISLELSEENGWKMNETPTGSWNTFYLFNQGLEIVSNTNQCPSTLNILNNLQRFLKNCTFGNACFSVLKPGTNITEHYGPCNVRTRCHLGLITPPNYTLTVNGSMSKWTKGKCLLFDDSYLHSVHSETSSLLRNSHLDRVIFMIDLWHYDVQDIEMKIIQDVFSS